MDAYEYSPDHPKRFADDSAEHAYAILRWMITAVIAGLIGLGLVLLLAGRG